MWNNKKRQKTECGHIEGTPDGEGYQRSITDTPLDVLWACDSHGKGQISKYLDACVHTWTTTYRLQGDQGKDGWTTLQKIVKS